MGEKPDPASRLGAHPGEGGTLFRLWSTRASSCAVVVFGPDGASIGREIPMRNAGEGVFEASDSAAGPGTLYKFRRDDQLLPDPYARFLPFGVHGPARVERSGYQWKHPVRRPEIGPDLLIYELHVGSFTPEGTWAAAAAKLPELERLGVTALELMPVAAFPGHRGWGYDGVALYAPQESYGTPDDFRAFVDRAHGLGLSVILDVVHNHFGPSGNYLSAYSPEYFTSRFPTPWGEAPDFRQPWMRRLVTESACHWIEEYGIDGLRLDATHAISDDSPVHILRELADRVHAIEGRPLVIAEDDRNDAGLIDRHGADAVYADDFHHQVRVLACGDRDGYYRCYRRDAAELARVIRQGWLYQGQLWPLSGAPRGTSAKHLHAGQLVYFLQNHDQVGNRAFGDRMHHGTGTEAWCAMSMLLLFLPQTALLFMGQEWAASSPFLYFTDHDPELGRLVTEGRRKEFAHFASFSEEIPDPQAEATFRRSVLDWSERASSKHARVLDLYRRMIDLRRADPVLRDMSRERCRAGASGDVLWVWRWSGSDHRMLLLNFGAPVVVSTLELPGPPGWTTFAKSCQGAVDGGVLGEHAAVLLATTE